MTTDEAITYIKLCEASLAIGVKGADRNQETFKKMVDALNYAENVLTVYSANEKLMKAREGDSDDD